MKFRLFAAFALSVSVLVMPGHAAAVPAPSPVSQILYRHWPEQFMQWVGAEVPYSMIELYVDPAAGPLYDIVLTERATGKRVHYSDKPWMVDLDKRMGYESYATKLQFDRPRNGGADSTYLLRFTDRNGAPVSWQFVQQSDVSDRGGGLSPAGIHPPVLMYRERSAVAGQGTALQVGKTVSVADVWTEIAAPPFFVPYRGAYTENLEIATFTDDGSAWTTQKAPSDLAAGAEWTLKSADGHLCTLKVLSVKGDAVTLAQTDDQTRAQVTIEARFANGVWTNRKIHFLPQGASSTKGITVAFNESNSDNGKFEVLSGKTRIASGWVEGKQSQRAWQFKDPEWLRSKPKVAKAQNISSGSN